MMISLREIQPSQIYLRESHVSYFTEDPVRIFSQEFPIRIMKCHGMPFRYFARNGNHRLFVCSRLGIGEIENVPEILEDMTYENHALEAYNDGVRTWYDLAGRVIPDNAWLALQK